MKCGWGARKNRKQGPLASLANPLAEYLPKMQIKSPEQCIAVIRTILDQVSEEITLGNGEKETLPVQDAEKLVRIGVILMCITVETGKVISDEITNRIWIAAATEMHPFKEYEK